MQSNLQYIISTLIALITLWLVYKTYKRSKVSLKLSIKELKLYERDFDKIIGLRLIVHFNNKGRVPIQGRNHDVKLNNVNLVEDSTEWFIIKAENIKLQPKKTDDISFRYLNKDKTITDINEWKKIGSGKKIRFRFVEDNSGKTFKSKKVKFDDILKGN